MGWFSPDRRGKLAVRKVFELISFENKIEYDEMNGFMLQIAIMYNRRKANKRLAFNAEELYTRLLQELDKAKIFIKADSSPKEETPEPFS